MQSYQPSNFENDLTLVQLELRLIGSTGARARRQTFSQDLQLWQLVTLKPFNLKNSILIALKDLSLLKKYIKNQETSSILRAVFALSKRPHLHREWPKKTSFFARHCIYLLKNPKYWFLAAGRSPESSRKYFSLTFFCLLATSVSHLRQGGAGCSSHLKCFIICSAGLV